MPNKKPKTALAKLLDNLKQVEEAPLRVAEHTEGVRYLVSHDKKGEEGEWHNIPEVKQEASDTETLKLVYIDPEACKPWQFADRPEDEMGDIVQLAHSIKEHGQQEPVLVRPLVGNKIKHYEIVFGNRRWRACQHAKVAMLAIIKPVSDQQAALCQKEENEQRKDLSDYARAKSYKAQLEAGIFAHETELSKYLNISKKTLNDLMAFVRIPAELVDVIPNFKQLSRAMAVRLAILAKDKVQLKKLIELGPKIGNRHINTTNIERYLDGVPTKKKAFVKVIDVTDQKGHLLFHIHENQQGLLTIKISKELAGRYKPDQVKEMLYNYLINCNHKGSGYEHNSM